LPTVVNLCHTKDFLIFKKGKKKKKHHLL
jgi:hypothetical protein